MIGEQASLVMEGPILLDGSSEEDLDDVPLAKRP